MTLGLVLVLGGLLVLRLLDLTLYGHLFDFPCFPPFVSQTTHLEKPGDLSYTVSKHHYNIHGNI